MWLVFISQKGIVNDGNIEKLFGGAETTLFGYCY